MILAMSGCTAQAKPMSVIRPSGQKFVSDITSGSVSGIPWQSEVVRQDSQLCAQAIVEYKIMSTSCGGSLHYPVNFEVEGNDSILFVDGIVGPQVQTLLEITLSNPNGVPVVIKQLGQDAAIRYFGFAGAPSEVLGLHALDVEGKQIYDDNGKIRDTWQSRPSVSPSAN